MIMMELFYEISIKSLMLKDLLEIISLILVFPHEYYFIYSQFYNQFLYIKQKMYQHAFQDSQFFLDSIIQDGSESYPKDYQPFFKFHEMDSGYDLFKDNFLNDQNSSQSVPVCHEEYENYIDQSIQKTQIEDPAPDIFLQEEQSGHKKQGSTNCQNSPKLMSKVLCQFFTKSSSQHYFSDQAKLYAKFGIEKLKKSPTISSLAQVFVQTPQQLKEQRKVSTNNHKFGFSLVDLDIKNYQQEFRAFVVQRRQECLQMAAKRQIKDIERLICFTKYVEAFIQNLERGVVKGKLKKF